MLESAKGTTFPNLNKIPVDYIDDVTSIVTNILDAHGIRYIKVGSSTTSKNSVNDIDIQVEMHDVIGYFKIEQSSNTEKAARKQLKELFSKLDFEVASSGINVFLCVPYLEGRFQVDLEVIYNIEKISRYHIHEIPSGSLYKGVHKQLLISRLAKTKNMFYSAWEGLFERTSDGKKGKLITNDWDSISYSLVGKYGGHHISCVENILKSLPYNESIKLLEEVEQDKNWR